MVGEMIGHAKFAKYALLLIVIHNDKGEPIGMSSGVSFKPKDLNGTYSFESNVYIPVDELISDITTRVIYDPTFV